MSGTEKRYLNCSVLASDSFHVTGVARGGVTAQPGLGRHEGNELLQLLQEEL